MPFSNNRDSFISGASIGTYSEPMYLYGYEQPVKSPNEPTGQRAFIIMKQVGSGAVNQYKRGTQYADGTITVTSSSDDATPLGLQGVMKTMPLYGLFSTITQSQYEDGIALLT